MLENLKPGYPSNEAGKYKHITQEVREMMSSLTHKLSGLDKTGSVGHSQEDEHGTRVITLAGNNTGATMRSNLDGKSGDEDGIPDEQDKLGTYVNSNFQGINNSLMLGGSYSTNDPGVHLDIADVYDHQKEKRGKEIVKGKKTDTSDGDDSSESD